MSITTTAIAGGTYGADIAYTAGETLASVQGAIDTWLIGHGWAVADAAAGTNAVAYKHLLPGGTPGGNQLHYAWIVLDYNTAGFVILRLYEAWNTTLNQWFTGAAHTGLNKATNDRNASDASVGESVLSQRLDLTNGGSIRVISRLGLWLYSSIPAGAGSSTGNGATGVVFRTRDVPALDSVGASAPAVLYINSSQFFTMVAGNYTYNHFSMPRAWDGTVTTASRAGKAGAVAAKAFPKVASLYPNTGWGSFGYQDSSAPFFGANTFSSLEPVSALEVAVFPSVIVAPFEWLGRCVNTAASLSGSAGTTGLVKLDGSGIPSAAGSDVPMVQLPHNILVAY